MAHGDMYADTKGKMIGGALILIILFGGFALLGYLAINDARTRSSQIEACMKKNAGAPCEIKSLAVPKE